jgi:hypothetical protein
VVSSLVKHFLRDLLTKFLRLAQRYIFFSSLVDPQISSLIEDNQDAGHVVAADTLSLLDVLSDGLVQQVVDYLLQVILASLLLLLQFVIDPSNHLLVGLLLPNAIATHDDEVNIVRDVEAVGVRVGGDGLLFRLEVVAPFVLQVTETTSQVQVAVDAPLGDNASRLGDAVDFDLALWLVVDRHLDHGARPAHGAARITRVSDIDLLGGVVHVNDVGGGSDAIQHHILRLIFAIFLLTREHLDDGRLFGRLFTAHIAQFFLALVSAQGDIHIEERAAKPLFNTRICRPVELLSDSRLLVGQYLAVMVAAVDGDFAATVSVEHSEETLFRSVHEAQIAHVSVLLKN